MVYKMSLNKKGVGMSEETLVRILLLIVTLFILVGAIVVAVKVISGQGNSFRSNMCYGINLFKSKAEFFSVFIPSACRATITDKPLTGTPSEVAEEIADQMAACWWMFGEGEIKAIENLAARDNIYDCYIFETENDIDWKSLIWYLKHYDVNFKPTNNIKDSLYNYFELADGKNSLCVDPELVKFSNDRPTYIKF